MCYPAETIWQTTTYNIPVLAMCLFNNGVKMYSSLALDGATFAAFN